MNTGFLVAIIISIMISIIVAAWVLTMSEDKTGKGLGIL